MAEEQRIFTLKIDPGASEKRIADLTADLKAATLANQALEKSFKAGELTLDEYGKQAAANKRVLTDLSGELRAETKVLALHTKQTKDASGSNNQMRAQLSQLTAAYNALSKEERENVEVGVKMKNEIRGLSDALKENESAVGDNRRNVGNYSGGLLDAAENMGVFGTFTSQVKDVQEKFSVALEFTRKGLLTNVGALKLFKLALAATGIGLIVIALGGLVSFLTRTQEGMDWVSQKTKGLTTVLSFLTDRLSEVGKVLFDAFSNPKQALSDLVDFLEGQVTNRIKAFSVIWDALRKGDLKQLNNGLFQLSTGVEDVIGKTARLASELNQVRLAGEEIAKQEQRLEKDRINNIATNKTLLGLIEAQKNIRDNENNTIQERQRANEKAAQLEQQRLKTLEGLAQRQVNILMAEAKIRGGMDKLRNEEVENIREAENELADIREDSLGRQNETITNRYQLEQELLERLAEADRARAEAAILLTREGTQARLEAQENLIKAELEIENRNAKLSLNQRKLNELKANAEILELRSEFYKRDIEQQIQYRGILGQLNKDFENRLTEDAWKATEARGQKVLAKDLEHIEAKIAAAKQAKDSLAEIDQERLDIAIETTTALSSLVEIVAGQSEEAANFQRALAVFEIGISAAKAVMSGIEKASAAGPFPANLLAIATTVATTLGYVAQAKALLSEGSAPKAPKIKGAGGGLLQGPSHAEGGIPGTGSFAGIEVEGDEALINKKSTAMFKPLLNAINIAGGGVPLMPTTYGQVGGIILPQSNKQLTREQMFAAPMGRPSMLPLIDYKLLAAEMAKVQIVTKVTDINAAQSKQTYTQNRASIK